MNKINAKYYLKYINKQIQSFHRFISKSKGISNVEKKYSDLFLN